MLEKFGPYQVVRKIGRGGMGTVFEGVHESTEDRCAVKVLAEWITQDAEPAKLQEFERLFREEIETLSQLKHDNIVRLTGFGEQEGLLFYTMELVEGPNLQEMLSEGHEFAWDEVVEIGVQICAALRHAHDRGILHRDLKPANLIWSGKGEGPVKLADFGIARHALDQLTDEIIGTADYMSPEQAAAKPVTARSDLYSVGSVMYSLLARRPPFRGPSRTQILDDLQTRRPLPLGKLVFDLPEELERIVDQLLEKEPSRRIASAEILSRRLRALLHAYRQGKLQDGRADDVDGEGDEFELHEPQTPATELSNTRREQTHVDEQTAAMTEMEAAADAESDAPPAQETLLDDHPGTEVQPDESGGPTTSFTEIDAEQSDAAPRHDAPAADHIRAGNWLSIVALTVVLAALAALGWRLSQPPAADEIYDRVAQAAVAQDHSQWVAVRDQIDLFLEHYPNDDRAAQVDAWRADHEWYKFWRQLERKADKLGELSLLPPVEQAFIEAARLDNSRKAGAATAYESCLELLRESGQNSGEAAEMKRHATHRLQQLAADPAARPSENRPWVGQSRTSDGRRAAVCSGANDTSQAWTGLACAMGRLPGRSGNGLRQRLAKG